MSIRAGILVMLQLGALTGSARASGPVRHDADYPMSSASFRQHLVEKAARYRERLDDKLQEHAVPEAKRADARKRLAAAIAKIDRAADKACADGTVTLAESKDVRSLSKQLRDTLYREIGLPRSKGD